MCGSPLYSERMPLMAIPSSVAAGAKKSGMCLVAPLSHAQDIQEWATRSLHGAITVVCIFSSIKATMFMVF